MSFSLTKSVSILLVLLFCAAFFTRILFAQTQGRSVTPPTFPQCSNKIATAGDRKHETEGTHKVPGKQDIDGNRDLYTLIDGNFVECTCPSTGGTGIQTNWWYINGLPLGRVDIDAYTRDGWLTENGSEWDLLDGQYLAKTEDFSCKKTNTQMTPTKTPTNTPTPRVTRAANATPTPTDTEKNDGSNDDLPDTGLPLPVVMGIVSIGGAGFYLRKHFTVR